MNRLDKSTYPHAVIPAGWKRLKDQVVHSRDREAILGGYVPANRYSIGLRANTYSESVFIRQIRKPKAGK